MCVRAAYSELYGQSFGRRRRRRSGDMVPSLLDLQSDTDASRRDTEVRCTDRHNVKKGGSRLPLTHWKFMDLSLILVGGVAQWLGRRSLTGKLSLIYA